MTALAGRTCVVQDDFARDRRPLAVESVRFVGRPVTRRRVAIRNGDTPSPERCVTVQYATLIGALRSAQPAELRRDTHTHAHTDTHTHTHIHTRTRI